jgi:PBP1b-binding outer membrane lipoprotein LpoB
MKKFLIALVIASALVMTGCPKKATPVEPTTAPTEQEAAEIQASVDEAQAGETL